MTYFEQLIQKQSHIQTHGEFIGQVRVQVLSRIGGQLASQVRGQVCSQIYYSVCDKVYDQLWVETK